MENKFTEVLFEVHCTPEAGHLPRYRVFVSGELFTERTWIWGDEVFLDESLPIDAPAGQYVIDCVLLEPEKASLKIKNMRVNKGRGKIIKNKVLEIL
jgi:hypothetical protein